MTESLEPKFANYINKNKLGLCRNSAGANLSDTLTFFGENGIFSEEECQSVVAVRKPFYQASQLFDLLKNKVKRLPEIVTHFQKQHQNVTAKILDKFLKDNLSLIPRNISIEGNNNIAESSNENKGVEDSSTGPQLLRSQSPTTSGNGNPALGTSSESSIISVVSSDTPGLSEEIEANIATVLENYLPGVYPPTTKGVALVINHVIFDGRPKNFRKGAEQDQENLVETFQELDFQVKELRDRTYKELKSDIAGFVDLVEEEKPDCLVVAVMSHGNKENKFMTRDNLWMSSWSKVVTKFNNANCPALKGKPKIFLFQFCRGNATDTGTQRDSPEDDYGPSLNIPSWTDMLVCYSTLDGHFAYRDTKKGTWFIQLFCRAVRKYGRSYHIWKLLNLVSEMMQEKRTIAGEKQICAFYNIGFTKKCYLGNSKITCKCKSE